MSGLAGGGSRRRKKQRRQPATLRALQKARNRFCKSKKMGRCDLQTYSYYQGDRIVKARAPILRDTIFPAHNGCTYFVAKLPLREKPYEVTSLCRGGRIVTGHRQFATKKEAKDAARRAAEWSSKAHPRSTRHRV